MPVPAQINLSGISGTLWQGHIRQVSYQHLTFSQVEWRIQPWALLSFKLKMSLESGQLQQLQQPFFKTDIALRPGSLALESTLVRLPVSELVPLLTLPLPIGASGDLIVDLTRLSVKHGQCTELVGHAAWLEARLQPPVGNWLQLGDFNGRLGCEQQHLVLVTDPNNALSLDIRAQVSAQGKLSVQGSLAPDASLPEEVHQAMRFVGQADANGRYPLAF